MLSVTEPDPDDFIHRLDLPSGQRNNGPLGRPVYSYTYDEGRRITQSSPLLNQLSWTYNSTFDRVTQMIDENGNRLAQTIDSNTGLVTQRQTYYAGWHQYVEPNDVSRDGNINSTDSQIVLDYLNQVGSGALTAPRTFGDDPLDVNNDGYVSPIDSLLIINYLNSHPNTGQREVPRNALESSTSFLYSSSTAGDPVTGLLTCATVSTGRAAGDVVTDYQYYNTPSDLTKHGRLHKIIEAPGTSIEAVTEFFYDGRGNVSKVIDPAGRETEFYHDTRDRLTAIIYPDPDGTGPLLPAETRYDYDVFGNLVATELINSHIENSHILVTSLIDASTYDGANRLTGRYQQDPGLTWYLYQDGSGNITRTSSKSVALAGTPLTAAVLTSYAADNSRITTSNTPGTITTPANDGSIRGLVETYQYDNASGLISTQQYDGTQSNPDTRTTTFRYDAMGRPTRIITPDPGPSIATVAGEMRNTDPAAGEVDGYIATVLYDNVGNTYRTTDVLGNTVDTRYDLLHRPISVTVDDPAGGAPLETTLGYTSTQIGWQVEATDAAGRQTLVEQDFLGARSAPSCHRPPAAPRVQPM